MENLNLKTLEKKPKFLTKIKEKQLLKIIENNDLEKFYSFSSKLIKGSKNILHLYFYLHKKNNLKNKLSKKIEEQTNERLFHNRFLDTWLDIINPEIYSYLKKNSKFSKKLKKPSKAKWIKTYLKVFVPIEEKLDSKKTPSTKRTILEKKYKKFIDKLKTKGEINDKQYEKAITMLYISSE